MIKIAISGGYGMGNVGDEAILDSMMAAIKSQCEAEFTVFSWDPEKTSKMHKVKAVNAITDILGILKTIYRSDLLILGGGGLLHDRTSPFNIPFWLSKVFFAKILGKPTMLYGIGVGPVDTSLGRFLMRLALNRVSLITVRDEKSRSVLKSAGVTESSIHVTADPALNLVPIEPHEAEMMLAGEGIKKGNQPLVGISICRFFRMGRLYLKRKKILSKEKDEKFERFKKIIARSADFLVESFDANVIFFPEIHGIDTEVALEIRQMMRHKDRGFVIKGEYHPGELRGIMGLMDFVIGMRLHFLIFAAGMNVPFIGIIYAPKVESFLKLVGQADRAAFAEDISEEEFLEKITAAWNSKEQIKEELEPKVRELKKKALINAELIKKLMKC